jgi:hypothetical protein
MATTSSKKWSSAGGQKMSKVKSVPQSKDITTPIYEVTSAPAAPKLGIEVQLQIWTLGGVASVKHHVVPFSDSHGRHFVLCWFILSYVNVFYVAFYIILSGEHHWTPAVQLKFIPRRQILPPVPDDATGHLLQATCARMDESCTLCFLCNCNRMYQDVIDMRAICNRYDSIYQLMNYSI